MNENKNNNLKNIVQPLAQHIYEADTTPSIRSIEKLNDRMEN